ncbi:MAG: 3-dehydroquinate synthase [Candidatus Melainabacteria bacterium]|nr:3-dehydroquinate synthase [Candidatus Melainabacteria bacterium]
MTLIEPLIIEIPASTRGYPIWVGDSLLTNAGELLQSVLPSASRLLVVCDAHTQPLFYERLQLSLQNAGFRVFCHVVGLGESVKCLSNVETLYGAAHAAGLNRQDAMLALGGGVVGDLTGFAAATYYRGVGFIQVPTTLLAQVDSSVGGKVGVNLKDVKNAIGAFYQPLAVISDRAVLAHLPRRELLAGLAEIVKYALIEQTAFADSRSVSPTLWDSLEQGASAWLSQLPALVQRCCEIKQAVVRRDERESLSDASGRMSLNLGHTFAHAYEALAGYGTLLHGEAVALGLMDAVRVSLAQGLLLRESATRIQRLLQALELVYPKPPEATEAAMLSVMRRDKKATASAIRLILPTDPLGVVTVSTVDHIPGRIFQAGPLDPLDPLS